MTRYMFFHAFTLLVVSVVAALAGLLWPSVCAFGSSACAFGRYFNPQNAKT